MALGISNLLSEARVVGEFLTFAGDALADAPSTADRSRAVLLIPGFMAGDATLYPVASRLRLSGHRVHFAGIWANIDCPLRTLERLERSLRSAARRSGGKAVIIGHSLGGIYARELARRLPQMVERAILLGSPLKHPVESSNGPVKALALALKRAHSRCIARIGEPCEICGFDLPRTPPDVPETIIYTKSDGVVEWESCIESGPNVENLEVRSSHCGLPLSLEVWKLITERLEHRPGKPDTVPPRNGRRLARLLPSYLKLVKSPATAA
jgi:pimeloyl-ACP methyl ester carboxylesterase